MQSLVKASPGPGCRSDNGGQEERRPAACWSCHGPVGQGRPFCPVATPSSRRAKWIISPGLASRPLSISTRKTWTAFISPFSGFCTRIVSPPKARVEKALSQQQATSLNEAYEALKDDLGRADYLIHLKGTKVLPEGCNLVNDALLLAETLELREALGEAETRDDVEVLARRADEDIRVCIEHLAELFAADDLEGACRQTTRLKYLRKLASETRAARARVAG